MKIIIYFALIVAFLMFYQKNPVYTIVIICIALGTYFLYKSRKSNGNRYRGGFRFLSGKSTYQNDNMDDILMLLMIQQIFSPSFNSELAKSELSTNEKQAEESEIDTIKREMLELLGDE